MPPQSGPVRVVEGSLDASGLRFAVVVSRFNAFVTERLLQGAIDCLLRSGAASDAVTVFWAPGAFELPGTVARVIDAQRHDAVVTLGCLIRGDTLHFELIAGEVTRGLGQLARSAAVPVVFGVLTTDTLEQAIDRAGAKAGNKGAEAAQAAIEQARLYQAIAATSRRSSRSKTKTRRSKG
jgi:6,7-dimethyl-8-ribityllumazine synthase